MVFKKQLAHELTKEFNSKKEADEAQQAFEETFQKRETPSADIPVFNTSHKEWNPVDFLFESGLAASKSDAKRLIEQKAVELNSSLVTSHASHLTLSNGDIIKVGKKKFLKIKLV